MIKHKIRSILYTRKKDAKILTYYNFIENTILSFKPLYYNSLIKKLNGTIYSRKRQLRDIADTRITTSVEDVAGSPRFYKDKKNPGFDCLESSVSNNRPIGAPGFSSEIWNSITGAHFGPIPSGLSPITEEEVRSSDRDCITRYSADTGTIGYYFASVVGNSTYRVAREFGFFVEKNRSCIVELIDDQLRLSRRNTSAGWPTFQKKNSMTASIDTEAWLKKFYTHSYSFSKNLNPLLFSPNFISNRFQAKYNSGTNLIDTKIRQIFIQPHRIYCVEIKYLYHTLERTITHMLNSTCPIYASGMRSVEVSEQIKRFRSLLNDDHLSHGNKALYSLDYSKFDSSVPAYFIDFYFLWIKEGLPLEAKEHVEFDYLRFYSKHTPVMYDNKITFQRRGVNSGSLTTNSLDTFVNCSILFSLQFILSNSSLVEWICRGKDIEKGLLKFCNINDIQNFDAPPRKDIITMGDDSLCLFSITELTVLKKLCMHMGMNVDTKHVCYGSNDPIFFLGRFWDENNCPYQSDQYLLSHCLYREKFYKKKDIDIDISQELEPIRIISICCALSNGFDFMERYFYNYDKLWNIIKNRLHIPLLKDVFPFKGIQRIDINQIFDWKNMS